MIGRNDINSMKMLSDEQLYDFLGGNRKSARLAFDELYNRFSTKIFTYCNRILFDSELAEDIFQETFLRFLESAKKERNMTNVSAFIFRIARNLCINEKARKHHSFLSFEELIYPVSDQSYETKERVDLLETALQALPQKYREVLVLKEFLGMSYQEIAEVLDSTLPSIRIRIYRAKQKLRDILAPYIEENEE